MSALLADLYDFTMVAAKRLVDSGPTHAALGEMRRHGVTFVLPDELLRKLGEPH